MTVSMRDLNRGCHGRALWASPRPRCTSVASGCGRRRITQAKRECVTSNACRVWKPQHLVPWRTERGVQSSVPEVRTGPFEATRIGGRGVRAYPRNKTYNSVAHGSPNPARRAGTALANCGPYPILKPDSDRLLSLPRRTQPKRARRHLAENLATPMNRNTFRGGWSRDPAECTAA
jgi:hypothetical protein